MELIDFIKTHLKEGFLPLSASFEAMEHFTCNFREVEETALREGVLPLRYKRNQKTISTQEQYILFQSHVVILGCGGLGGFVSEMLTRIGVGTLTLIDGDVFEEHNLNRQNFSSIQTLGQNKAKVLAHKLQEINPALHVNIQPTFLSLPNDENLLLKANVIVDALDNPELKCSVARWAKENHNAFVHGAIAGYYAQFSSCDTLENLYRTSGDGAEKTSGNPSFTVCFAASIQSAEVVKLLLGKTHLKSPLMADLWEYEFNLL